MAKKPKKRKPQRPAGELPRPRTLDDVIVTVVTAPPRTLDDFTVKKGPSR